MIFKDITKYVPAYFAVSQHFIYLFSTLNSHNYLNEIRKETNLEKRRTLDVQIIDIADEIAYAVHDLEDALALRYFNVDELLYEIEQNNDHAAKQLKEIIDTARKYASTSSSHKTIQEYSQVLRKSIVSKLTNELINDIKLSEITDKRTIKEHGTTDGQKELTLNKYKDLAKILKKTIFSCINRDKDIAIYEKKGEKILTDLYNLFTNETYNNKGILLPPDYRPYEGYGIIQGSIDYLAGMMDTYAIAKYEELFNTKFSEIKIAN